MYPHLSWNALRLILTLALPTVLYSFLEIMVGAVDIYFAGFIGSEAVASIGFARQLFLVLMIGTLAITTGTITLISQHFGAQDFSKASSVAFHAIVLSVFGGILFGVIGVWVAKPCLFLIGAREEVLIQSSAYLETLMAGVIFLLFNFSTTAIFRAVGDSKTPLKIALLVNTLNTGFDYILIFGIGPFPELGVQGIAYGTISARLVGAAIALFILTRKKRDVRIHFEKDIHLDIIYKMMAVGIPTGLSGFARNGARIVFFAIIASTSYGTHAVAAATAGFQLRLFAIMPALAFQVASSALVGQAIGKNNLAEAESYGWTTIVFVGITFLLQSLILFLFPYTLIALFSDDPRVIELGKITLQWIAVEQFANCLSIAASGALAGAGDTKPSMRYTVIAQWLFMMPFALLLTHPLEWDLQGAWLIWGVAPIIQCVLTVNRFASGHWKKISMR